MLRASIASSIFLILILATARQSFAGTCVNIGDYPPGYLNVYVPIDGALSAIPTQRNPFYQAKVVTDRKEYQIGLSPADGEVTDYFVSWLVPPPKVVTSVDFTSRAIVATLSSRTNNTFERTVVVLGCDNVAWHSGRGWWCEKLVKTAEIQLDPFEVSDPVPIDIEHVPQQATSISYDSEWITVLKNETTVAIYRIQEATSTTPTTWVFYQELSCDSSASLWAVALSKTTKPANPQGTTAMGSVLGFPFSYPFSLPFFRDISDWNPLLHTLLWNATSESWILLADRVDGSLWPQFSSASMIFGASLHSVNRDVSIVCLDLSKYGSRATYPYAAAKPRGILQQIDVRACRVNDVQVVPCNSIRSVLRLLAPDSVRWQIEATTEEYQCMLVRGVAQAAPLSVLTTYRAGVEGNYTYTVNMVSVFPNTQQPSITDLSIPDTDFVVQTDFIGYVLLNCIQIIYANTLPGYESVIGYTCEIGGAPCRTTVRCPVGFFKANAADLSPCLPCPAGTYQPAEGSKSCLACLPEQYCPAGTTLPRNKSEIVEISTSSPMPFKTRQKHTTVQQRMIAAVFNPAALDDGPNKQQFITLVITSVVACGVILVLWLLNQRGKATGILKFALKLDLFKEPSFKISKSKIVEKGTITGLLFTVIFIISMSMCLWFVVAFYDSYTPFFAVADSGCPAVNAESPLGSNNDNTISVETNDGDESEYMPILAFMRKFLTYTVEIKLLDMRKFGHTTLEQCNQVSLSIFRFPGCYNQEGRLCQASDWSIYPDKTDPFNNTCVVRVSVETPHTLSESHQIQLTLGIERGYFTAMVVSIKASCEKCAPAFKVAEFELTHSFVVSEVTNETCTGGLIFPVASSYVVRGVSLDSSDPIKQGYLSLTTSALHSAPATSIQNWYLLGTKVMTVGIPVSETLFWVVQKSNRAASQTDLMVVLILTAIALYSVFRVMVKIVMKVHSKAGKCCRRWNRRKEECDVDGSATSSAASLKEDSPLLMSPF